MRVLLTRPDRDSAPIAAMLRAKGHEPVAAPLLSVEFDNEARVDLSDIQAVLLTSANGARALTTATDRRDVAVLAVGAATAAAAADTGFGDVASANGDIDDLAALVRCRLQPGGGRLLHVAGRDVAGDLAALLPEFEVDRVVLYRAKTARALPARIREALAVKRLDAVLFYSPRTAATFARLVNRAGLVHHCAAVSAVCLSTAVRNALQGVAFQSVVVADRPDQDSLLTALDTLARQKES